MPRIRNLEIDLLRSFVAVAEAKSFTLAGEQVLRNQSTVSLQMRRLETLIGRPLLDRSPHHVLLTAEGEALYARAREILAINDAAIAEISEPDMVGAVRLGVPEDFATAHLPAILARFQHAFPRVTLEVTCELTLNILDRFRAGLIDLALIKREPKLRAAKAVSVWLEPLVWVASAAEAAMQETIPLVVSPEPCVYRKRATKSLSQAGRKWRIAYTCSSLAGSQAAVRAGLGLTVLPEGLVPRDLRVLDPDAKLPDLKDTEIALMAKPKLTPPAARLKAHIIRSLEREPRHVG